MVLKVFIQSKEDGMLLFSLVSISLIRSPHLHPTVIKRLSRAKRLTLTSKNKKATQAPSHLLNCNLVLLFLSLLLHNLSKMKFLKGKLYINLFPRSLTGILTLCILDYHIQHHLLLILWGLFHI